MGSLEERMLNAIGAAAKTHSLFKTLAYDDSHWAVSTPVVSISTLNNTAQKAVFFRCKFDVPAGQATSAVSFRSSFLPPSRSLHHI